MLHSLGSANTMEAQMIESCAMSFELPPLVRSGIFLSFLSFKKAELGFSCFLEKETLDYPTQQRSA